MGHAYANYFIKAYVVCYRKMPKTKKITVSFLGKIPFKILKCPQKSNTFHPAASTAGPGPTFIGLLLRFFNNVQTEWPQNIDPN